MSRFSCLTRESSCFSRSFSELKRASSECNGRNCIHNLMASLSTEFPRNLSTQLVKEVTADFMGHLSFPTVQKTHLVLKLFNQRRCAGYRLC
jgi:hypothetical protein